MQHKKIFIAGRKKSRIFVFGSADGRVQYSDGLHQGGKLTITAKD